MRYMDAAMDVQNTIEIPKIAAAVNEPAPASAIDRGLAARLTDNDANLFQGMLLLFLQMAPERIEKIQNAVSRDDRQVIEREVRKIRSAAERIAAVSVA